LIVPLALIIAVAGAGTLWRRVQLARARIQTAEQRVVAHEAQPPPSLLSSPTLSPSESPTVTVTSQPAGARLFVDGTARGKTPLELPRRGRAQAGHHRRRLSPVSRSAWATEPPRRQAAAGRATGELHGQGGPEGRMQRRSPRHRRRRRHRARLPRRRAHPHQARPAPVGALRARR
jgi:hypothetical protein